MLGATLLSIIMAVSKVSKHEINVKDLSTKSVTFFPARALVIREIKNLQLNRGPNVIEIYGLTPTVDENSVQINGTGHGSGSSAIITDVVVDSVPNREIFEIVYASDNGMSEGDHSSDDDETASGFKPRQLKEEDGRDEENDSAIQAISKEQERLKREGHAAIEMRTSAESQLRTWDQYSGSISAKTSSIKDLSDSMKKYCEERTTLYEQYYEANKRVNEASQVFWEKQKKLEILKTESERRKRKSIRLQMKIDHQKELKKAAKKAEGLRNLAEKEKFWPRKVYRITLHLDCIDYTPTSSRRGSSENLSAAPKEELTAEIDQDMTSNTASIIDLTLSYVTTEAGWKPRYEFKLSSVNMSTSIIYRAEYSNLTSETWKDANISFSTSQTTITSLEDSKAPSMNAWPIRISNGFHSPEGDLQSIQERTQTFAFPPGERKPTSIREDLFGVKPFQKSNISGVLYGSDDNASRVNTKGCFGASQPYVDSSLFGQLAGKTSETSDTMPQSQQISDSTDRPRFGFGAPVPVSHTQEPPESKSVDSSSGTTGHDLLFEETNYEESGLTSIYEVSGTRTLEPSSMKRQYNIVTLQTPVKDLYHLAVPKLQKIAYVYAKLRNPSSQSTILKGVAGITLDNSFLGTITIGRVGPNQDFKIPLGPDPSVRISYPKPSTQRRVLGILDKSIIAQFRSIRLENTKVDPLTIKVLDQVPKPKSGELEIKIVEPHQLSKEGDSIETGNDATQATTNLLQAGSAGKCVQTQWGKATATLRKDGQITWDCVIESGKACSLNLSYEVWLPLNSKVVSC